MAPQNSCGLSSDSPHSSITTGSPLGVMPTSTPEGMKRELLMNGKAVARLLQSSVKVRRNSSRAAGKKERKAGARQGTRVFTLKAQRIACDFYTGRSKQIGQVREIRQG